MYIVEANYDVKRGKHSFRNFFADMLYVYYLLMAAKVLERLGRDERFN